MKVVSKHQIYMTIFLKGLPDMKLAIRVFGFVVAVAGLTAASMTLPAKTTVLNRQAAYSALPTPSCGPDMGCTLPPGR